jgi:enoyl-CoA hydratase/carnithine racemase
MSNIESTLDGQVLAIRFNRADKKHALTPQMYQQLTELLTEAKANEEILVVTLTGGEDCFSAGNDLPSFLQSGAINFDHPVVKFLVAIRDFPKPIIAGVAGHAVGIGTTMLLHCDLIYAADNAKFQLPFVPLGLCPEAGASLLLPHLMGYHKAAELLLFGEPFNAAKANELNLVTAVVSDVAIGEYINQRAQQLAKLPSSSVAVTKMLMKRSAVYDEQLKTLMAVEIEYFDQQLNSPQCQQIIKSLVGR